ncbi:MAG: RdgB/HAM1 family non-canonical purine NTP pyrophosphatase [Pseudomonadota bacterium]
MPPAPSSPLGPYRKAGKLVIASKNTGKIREIGALLDPFGMTVTSAYDLGLDDVDETGTTFAENARLKAHASAKATGLPALSDDSGLCVAALDGAPGVYSADWAERQDANGTVTRDFGWAMEKVEKAVREQMAGGDGRNDWSAYFVCMLCLALPDGTDHLFEGRVQGTLDFPPRGQNGFGYDPIFVADGHTQSFGEMEPDAKHAISHRADAFEKFVAACFAQT